MLEACRTPELITELTLQPVRRHGVDAAIRESVPEIGRIHDLTNHAAGVMPYQASGSSPFVLGK